MRPLVYQVWATGIRYEYGMFRQKIENGQQVERPDAWLEKGAPWEFIRPSKRFTVEFGGNIHFEGKKCIWQDTEKVTALAYDQMIPGIKIILQQHYAYGLLMRVKYLILQILTALCHLSSYSNCFDF